MKQEPLNLEKFMIVGVAMGGTKKVRSVKVSIDGGKSWKRAKFIGPDLGKYAWRQFVLETTLSSGNYNIASLASNGSDKQPELRMENKEVMRTMVGKIIA